MAVNFPGREGLPLSCILGDDEGPVVFPIRDIDIPEWDDRIPDRDMVIPFTTRKSPE